MPVAELGLHFDGMGAFLRSKLTPQTARKVILQGHKFTSSEALADSIVDEIAPPEEMLERALAIAERVKSKAKTGVYGLLRGELVGEAARAFQQISYVRSRLVSRQAKVKL
jgi:Delta3-Delta2-enoyl-CoA isomerase